MPDTNEERLLSELLGDLARDDAHLAVSPRLHRRVMAGWDTLRWKLEARSWKLEAGSSKLEARSWKLEARSWKLFGVAALSAAALALAVSAVMQLGFTANRSRVDPGEQRPPIATATPQPKDVMLEATRPSGGPPANRAAPRRRQAVAENTVVSFVPLVPMTADELSGSFSIARVQIGQTQADVLLGEDGMARAIRVSTDANTPWRSR